MNFQIAPSTILQRVAGRGLLLTAFMLIIPGIACAASEDWKTIINDKFASAPNSPLADCGWRTMGNDAVFVVSPEGGSAANGNAAGGKSVALYDCAPTGDFRIKMEADVQPGAGQWLGVGFSKGDDLFWTPVGQLLVLIKGSMNAAAEGSAEIYANGTAIVIRTASGNFGFDPAKPTHVQVLYDKKANTVMVVLNGVAVVDGHALTPFVPEIRAAGIMMNLPAPNDPKMRLSNFKVSLQGGILQKAK